jgi:uncharacterized membrane protein YhaH (DUF805 family)
MSNLFIKGIGGMEWIVIVLSVIIIYFVIRIFSRGRMRRRVFLGLTLISIPLSFIGVGIIIFIISCVRRAHDVGVSGWWCIIPFYPTLLFFISPESGENKYGVNPRKSKINNINETNGEKISEM